MTTAALASAVATAAATFAVTVDESDDDMLPLASIVTVPSASETPQQGEKARDGTPHQI